MTPVKTTSRERVLKALAHEEPDIVPTALGGGYTLAPSNHLQAEVLAVNVVALFESAHRFERYPLPADLTLGT